MIPAAGSLLVSTIMVLPLVLLLKLEELSGGHADCGQYWFIGMFSGLIFVLYCGYTSECQYYALFVALFLLCESWITFEEVDMNFKIWLVIVSGFNNCFDSLWQKSKSWKIKVMTTFYPVYDFTKILLEMKKQTCSLSGTVSSHEYELSAVWA